jgi:branched-chain amino acid transport system substrate-binding protein
VADYWSPDRGSGSAELYAKYSKTLGRTIDVSVVAATYTAAKILLDAVTAANSDDPDAINNAVGRTDADYPLGHVKFDSSNRYPVEPVEDQWQGTSSVQVYPTGSGTAKLVVPVTGLS